MKKIVIAVGAIILSILVGIVVFTFFTKGKDDVSFTSADNKVNITFKDVTKEGTNGQPGQIGFSPYDKDNFYSEYIKSNTDFLHYAVDSNNVDNEDDSVYVLLKGGHYFFLQCGSDGAILYDGLRACYTGENEYVTNLPYMNDFSASEVTTVEWSETVGMNSYEDLLEYYGRLDDSLYKVADDEKTIYLSIYNKFEDKWMDSGAKITITEKGFDIVLMPEYAEYREDEKC